MNKLKQITELCNHHIIIEINNHNSPCNTYTTVKKYLKSFSKFKIREIGETIFNKMVETNIVIFIRFYPKNATGDWSVYHYDINMGLKKVWHILKIFQKKRGRKT